jgi:hypothetical protein
VYTNPVLLKDTIPIIFNGGAYGTYIEWVLTTLTSPADITPPFNQNGNSHLYVGRHLSDMNGWNNYLNSKNLSQFVRLHPKSTKEESISENLELILLSVDKMIYLYPDCNSVILNINNYYDKIWTNWWQKRLLDAQFADNLYSNWPVNPDTPYDQIPTWILREILSFNLMPAWHDQIEWYHPDKWQNSKCLVINIHAILYNFEFTLTSIQNFCNLQFTKQIKELIPYHTQMLKLQKYLDQDWLCHQIVDSTIAGKNFIWAELPLPSQSWVQWELRNQGFEIECCGLDIFPTNSIQLKKLLYSI